MFHSWDSPRLLVCGTGLYLEQNDISFITVAICGGYISKYPRPWVARAAEQTRSAHQKIDCQPSHCSEEHHVSLAWMEHVSVELRKKYMVIHIYGMTLNTAKSADQYYSSYSYQSSSLISYLMYSDLHHDCKPYEQTIECFTVSLCRKKL